MSRFTTDEKYTRIECPHGECSEQLPETEWNFQQVTDHMCPNNHTFRVEGTSLDNIIVYQIDPKLLDSEYLV